MPRDYSQRPHGHKRVKQAGRDLSLRASHLTSYTRPMRRAVLFRQLGEGRDTPLVAIPFTYQLLNCLLTMISDRPRLRIRGPDRWRAPRRCFLRGGGLRISLAWAWSPRLFRSPKFA